MKSSKNQKTVINKKSDTQLNPVLMGFIFSFFPYVILLIIAIGLNKAPEFLIDPNFAVNSFILGIVIGGTIASINKIKKIKVDLKENGIIGNKKNAQKWVKNLRKNLNSKTQIIYGIVVMIFVTPIFTIFSLYTQNIYGTTFYFSYIILIAMPLAFSFGIVLWGMLLELFWLFSFQNIKGKPDIIKLGMKINDKYKSFLPILGLKGNELRLKIRLLHPDRFSGLKPLISISLFGTILEAIIFSVLFLLYFNVEYIIGLIGAIILGAFMISTSLYTIITILNMSTEAKRYKMNKIIKKIEKKHEDILTNKMQDHKNNMDFLELHEKILKTYHTTGTIPFDAGIIIQLLSGAAIPLILFFMGRLF